VEIIILVGQRQLHVKSGTKIDSPAVSDPWYWRLQLEAEVDQSSAWRRVF
jgi:hypothetical protein